MHEVVAGGREREVGALDLGVAAGRERDAEAAGDLAQHAANSSQLPHLKTEPGCAQRRLTVRYKLTHGNMVGTTSMRQSELSGGQGAWGDAEPRRRDGSKHLCLP